jgi:hypothetical protein
MTPAAMDYITAMVESAREDFEAGQLDVDSFGDLIGILRYAMALRDGKVANQQGANDAR